MRPRVLNNLLEAAKSARERLAEDGCDCNGPAGAPPCVLCQLTWAIAVEESQLPLGHAYAGSEGDDSYCWMHVSAFGHGDCGQPRSAHAPQNACRPCAAAVEALDAVGAPAGEWPCDRVVALAAQRDEARANYQFMVERAADTRLDGYRELAARAAAAENQVDELRRQLKAAEIARDKALAREQLLADLAARMGDDDPCCYCHDDDCSGCLHPSLGCAGIAGPFCPLSSNEYPFCPNCERDFGGTSGAIYVEDAE